MNTRLAILCALILVLGCCMSTAQAADDADKIRIILDTDANNELDDQHAIAYLLFNGDKFAVEGITVNATSVKNPKWADRVTIGAPKFVDGKWIDRPDNPRKIVIWENFDKKGIMKDFYTRMDKYVLVKP